MIRVVHHQIPLRPLSAMCGLRVQVSVAEGSLAPCSSIEFFSEGLLRPGLTPLTSPGCSAFTCKLYIFGRRWALRRICRTCWMQQK